MGEKRCAVLDYPLPSGIIIYSVFEFTKTTATHSHMRAEELM